MANEAVIVELQAGMNAVDVTVADGTGISKGTLMSAGQIGTSRTAVKSAGDGANACAFAGIAAAEKEASDGATNLACHQVGIFDLYAAAGPAIAAGQKVYLSGSNMIAGVGSNGMEAQRALSAGYIVGTALESTAAGTAEVIEVDIGNR